MSVDNPPHYLHYDNSMMFIMLLEKCNFSCPHCIWLDGRLEHVPAIYPGFKLTITQIRTCLADCLRVPGMKRLHFSGGEPTLWKDGGMNFVDLLLEVARKGFTASFITNGSNFEHYIKCRNFFQKYYSHAQQDLRIQLTVDTFHDNFDRETGKSSCLDNILKSKKELHIDIDRNLIVEVVAVISKSPESLLPQKMVEYYKSKGIDFIFTPLLNAGKAKSFSQLCPELDKATPESLGAFYPFYSSWYNQCEETQSIRLWVDEYRLFGEFLAPLGQLNQSALEEFFRNRAPGI